MVLIATQLAAEVLSEHLQGQHVLRASPNVQARDQSNVPLARGCTRAECALWRESRQTHVLHDELAGLRQLAAHAHNNARDQVGIGK